MSVSFFSIRRLLGGFRVEGEGEGEGRRSVDFELTLLFRFASFFTQSHRLRPSIDPRLGILHRTTRIRHPEAHHHPSCSSEGRQRESSLLFSSTRLFLSFDAPSSLSDAFSFLFRFFDPSSQPVPRIRHPDWLHKRVATKEDKFQQHKITDMFAKMRADAPDTPDLEDYGKNRDNPAQRQLAKIFKKKSSSKGNGREVVDEVVESLPDPFVDYRGWIRVSKVKWRKQREQKLRDKATGGRVTSQAEKGTISSIFRQRTLGLSTLTWEVVQISPSSKAGVFNLWLSIDNVFQKVKLRVPRQFYLNLRSIPKKKPFLPGYKTESLVRTLPRNHPCHNLFRITVDEDKFIEGESHFSNLINNPNVDGVYELQVSFETRPFFFSFGLFLRLELTSSSSFLSSPRSLSSSELFSPSERHALSTRPSREDSTEGSTKDSISPTSNDQDLPSRNDPISTPATEFDTSTSTTRVRTPVKSSVSSLQETQRGSAPSTPNPLFESTTSPSSTRIGSPNSLPTMLETESSTTLPLSTSSSPLTRRNPLGTRPSTGNSRLSRTRRLNRRCSSSSRLNLSSSSVNERRRRTTSPS